MIPPEKSASFVCQMEAVLDAYATAYDERFPLVCLDERPCQLLAHTREPLPMKPGQVEREDHEYLRAGTCCVLMAFEPLRAWRRAWVRPQRRRLEFAEVARELVALYPEAERVRLVCDNLNTHAAASFYERYPAEEARWLAERVEFVYTPAHGSWLNVVEIEFSALVRQCLSRRIGTLEEMEREVTAWIEARNAAGATVEWHLNIAEARVKLNRLYPSL